MKIGQVFFLSVRGGAHLPVKECQFSGEQSWPASVTI